MRESHSKIIDVKCEVMTTYVAIDWRYHSLVWRSVLEQLKVRAMSAPEELELLDHGGWVHVQLPRHPVTVILDGPDLVKWLAADYLDKELNRLLQIRHSKPNVIQAAKARHAVPRMVFRHERARPGRPVPTPPAA